VAEPVISIWDLSYRYRGQEKPALDGVNLEASEREFVVVMGYSGAGKSKLYTSLDQLVPHLLLRGRERAMAAEGERIKV